MTESSKYAPQIATHDKVKNSPFGDFDYTSLKESRKVFLSGNGSTESWKSAIRRDISPEQLIEMRNAFGRGTLGQEDFELVSRGTPCEFRNEKCEQLSTGSINFDITSIGEETIFHCDDHKEMILEDLAGEIDRGAINAAIGENGKGRA